MTQKQFDMYDKVQTQLEGLYLEVSTLSKKSQNDAVNKFKLKFINQILLEANILLEEFKPFADFDVFDEADLPTTSDVALILTQYNKCVSKFKDDNIINNSGTWYWLIDGKKSDFKTNKIHRM